MPDKNMDTQEQHHISTKITIKARTTPLVRAHIALLDHELLLPQQGEIFNLVSYHYQTLQKWHSEHTGWRIEQRNSIYRLLRTSSMLLSSRGKQTLQDPRDYACLAWTLSYAASRQQTGKGGEQQFLISSLTHYLLEQAQHADAAMQLDLRRRADRYSMMHALKYLEGINAIHLVEGQSQEWVESDAEMLYEFTDVTYLLITSLDFDAVKTVAARVHTPSASLQPALLTSVTEVQTRMWQTLLLGPIFLRYDDTDAFDFLLKKADTIEADLAATFGWLLEINRDYACIVRGEGTNGESGTLLNMGSANDQIIVLLCDVLRKEVESGHIHPNSYGCLLLSLADVEDLFTTRIRPYYGNFWGKEARTTSATSLLSEAYRKMRSIGLLRGPDANGNILVLPLAARFEPRYSELELTASQAKQTKGHANVSSSDAEDR